MREESWKLWVLEWASVIGVILLVLAVGAGALCIVWKICDVTVKGVTSPFSDAGYCETEQTIEKSWSVREDFDHLKLVDEFKARHPDFKQVSLKLEGGFWKKVTLTLKKRPAARVY